MELGTELLVLEVAATNNGRFLQDEKRVNLQDFMEELRKGIEQSEEMAIDWTVEMRFYLEKIVKIKS